MQRRRETSTCVPTQLLQQKGLGGRGGGRGCWERKSAGTKTPGPGGLEASRRQSRHPQREKGTPAHRDLSERLTDRGTDTTAVNGRELRWRRNGQPSGRTRSPQLEAASVSEAEEAGEALQGDEQDFSEESSAFSSQPVGVAGEIGNSPSFSRFFCFILRFWNQILTCVSLSWREAAISTRLALVRYLLK